MNYDNGESIFLNKDDRDSHQSVSSDEIDEKCLVEQKLAVPPGQKPHEN